MTDWSTETPPQLQQSQCKSVAKRQDAAGSADDRRRRKAMQGPLYNLRRRSVIHQRTRSDMMRTEGEASGQEVGGTVTGQNWSEIKSFDDCWTFQMYSVYSRNK